MNKNKVVLITGANSGIGKDTARQLALIPDTEKIILACRSKEKAIQAKKELEEITNRNIFEILIVDVSRLDSVKAAIAQIDYTIDAIIMNAGGMGGKHPIQLTKDGVTQIFATNVLGHAYLLESLLEKGQLKNVALFSSSEAARGIKKMGIKQPHLKNSSIEEFNAIINGSAFQSKIDGMEVYSLTKYIGTLWMSALAKKYPDLKFISMSPGGTKGTNVMNDMPPVQRFMFKYIMMPIVMPLLGMAHDLASGAKRYVKGINDSSLHSGKFYGSKAKVLTGPVIDQSGIFPDLNNLSFQDNAYKAIHRYF